MPPIPLTILSSLSMQHTLLGNITPDTHLHANLNLSMYLHPFPHFNQRSMVPIAINTKRKGGTRHQETPIQQYLGSSVWNRSTGQWLYSPSTLGAMGSNPPTPPAGPL